MVSRLLISMEASCWDKVEGKGIIKHRQPENQVRLGLRAWEAWYAAQRVKMAMKLGIGYF